MQMKLTHYIYICTSLAMLTSCHHDDIDRVYTVGEEDNAIRLEAGIVDGGATVKTRASWDNGTGDRHGKHLTLAEGIKMTLQVNGVWTNHKDAYGQNATAVTKETTATVGEDTSNSKHNPVSMAPQLYWDDYGTADPENKETGRTTGLTIYGVAINDATQSALAVSNWESLTWTLPSDQSTTANDWTKNDLIISNNVRVTPGGDGTLKFDEWKNGSSNNLLEFKHAMSKITVNLKANKGFPTSGSNLIGNTPNKFESNPTVELLTRNESGDELNYAVTKGSVNIQTGAVTASSEESDKEKVVMKQEHVHEAWPNDASEFQYTVQMTALVVPGTVLGATHNDGNATTLSTAQKKTIAKITADGNVYYVNAQNISVAMGSTFTTEPGKNYILNITVDKTEVHVEATIANWVDVVAAEATPKIEITSNYGTAGNNFNKDYSFYFSTNKDYIADDQDFYGTLATDATLYGEERKYVNSSSQFNTPLYWPNHSTKYFFRGVWPETTTISSETLSSSDATSVSDKKPSVSVFTAKDDNKLHQGIYVRNMKYVENTFPSDLMVAIPTFIAQDEDSRFNEPEDGIPATEGKISMNFTYRMAQVEVHLKSSGSGLADNIDFGSSDGANIAQVTISNGMTAGYVLLADGSVKYATGATSASYEMTPRLTDLTSVVVPTAEIYAGTMNWIDYPTLVRHDAVIPQSLGTDDLPLKFVIKTGSVSLTYDTYEIPIKDIPITSINEIPQSAGTKITEWEAGKHYIYTLRITKTKVTIEASMQNWIPVIAGGDFWL